ncbi:hypothetical protein CYMTET_8177 [Cymbomonas tetramitiformis]|uniref:Uncharacterized protein n=1 Tax=Cymbomonas tetramitiformis TaxID=36881 RepID=A0AAE0GTJ9_9CHLO|nr:hypothetical protein CYMTET_8177 [Cymbomonas tetramitiformis]
MFMISNTFLTPVFRPNHVSGTCGTEDDNGIAFEIVEAHQDRLLVANTFESNNPSLPDMPLAESVDNSQTGRLNVAYIKTSESDTVASKSLRVKTGQGGIDTSLVDEAATGRSYGVSHSRGVSGIEVPSQYQRTASSQLQDGSFPGTAGPLTLDTTSMPIAAAGSHGQVQRTGSGMDLGATGTTTSSDYELPSTKAAEKLLSGHKGTGATSFEKTALSSGNTNKDDSSHRERGRSSFADKNRGHSHGAADLEGAQHSASPPANGSSSPALRALYNVDAYRGLIEGTTTFDDNDEFELAAQKALAARMAAEVALPAVQLWVDRGWSLPQNNEEKARVLEQYLREQPFAGSPSLPPSREDSEGQGPNQAELLDLDLDDTPSTVAMRIEREEQALLLRPPPTAARMQQAAVLNAAPLPAGSGHGQGTASGAYGGRSPLHINGEPRLHGVLVAKGLRGVERNGQWRFQWQRLTRLQGGKEKVETLSGERSPHYKILEDDCGCRLRLHAARRLPNGKLDRNVLHACSSYIPPLDAQHLAHASGVWDAGRDGRALLHATTRGQYDSSSDTDTDSEHGADAAGEGSGREREAAVLARAIQEKDTLKMMEVATAKEAEAQFLMESMREAGKTEEEQNQHQVRAQGLFGEAARLFRKSAKLENVEAAFLLARMYDHGAGLEGGAPHAAAAARWYEHAAVRGHGEAMNNLAVLCHSEGGTGLQQNVELAVGWFVRAVIAGHHAAICNLGMCFEEGSGVKQDWARAEQLYREAAIAGNVTALASLGFLCTLQEQYEGAARAFVLAAEQGNEEAAVGLRRLLQGTFARNSRRRRHGDHPSTNAQSPSETEDDSTVSRAATPSAAKHIERRLSVLKVAAAAEQAMPSGVQDGGVELAEMGRRSSSGIGQQKGGAELALAVERDEDSVGCWRRPCVRWRRRLKKRQSKNPVELTNGQLQTAPPLGKSRVGVLAGFTSESTHGEQYKALAEHLVQALGKLQDVRLDALIQDAVNATLRPASSSTKAIPGSPPIGMTENDNPLYND